jgi:putative PIN family toxin of toxin-antitoxin system
MKKGKDRIIIDTNLWISFLLKKDYSKLDKLFSEKKIILLMSENLLIEFIDVATRPKFSKYFSFEDIKELAVEISSRALFVEVSSKIIQCRDPKDDFLLSLSKDGNATHLITGDNDLLEIGKFENTIILNMSNYLENK